MRKYIVDIFILLGDDKYKLPLLLILFLVASMIDLIGLSLIAPYLMLVIDPNSSNEYLLFILNFINIPISDAISWIGVILVVVFTVKAFLAIYINKRIIKFGQYQQVKLRKFLMKNYQNMPYIEYLKNNSSRYIYNIQQLTQQFGQSVLMPVLRLSSEGVVALAIFIFLAWQDFFALSLLVLILGFMVIVYDSLIRDNIKRYGELANKHSVDLIQSVNEGLEGFKEVKVLGKENYFYHRVRVSAENFAFYSGKSQLLALIPRYLLELSMVIFIVIFINGTMVFNENSDTLIQTMATFSVAALRLLPSVNVLSSSLVQLRHSRDATSRLCNDVSHLRVLQKSQRSYKDSPKNLCNFNGLILDRVCYAYPGALNNTLNNVSLTINSGEVIGFIGASGSGKTTLVDIILGILSPDTGSVRLNSNPLKQTTDCFKGQFAYLPQQVFLIDSTIAENIALGVKYNEINKLKLENSIKKSRLSELIESLPEGVDTIIGERGARLSGGQRQRISLARAFYHQRNVLVMDESTSALDTETEKEIVQEIRYLKGKSTLIIIAHRLSTLKDCDRIYKLINGNLINVGRIEDGVS
jgi:ABC-type multidrug transport system fused ATPase/permease subunit